MATILVVGGAGYIGSHINKELNKKGYGTVVYDSLVAGHEWAVKWGKFEKGDLSDRERLKEVFNKYQFEGVIDLAAFLAVGESVKEPKKYYRNNVVNTMNLLEEMLDHKVNKLIFSSTAATFGDPQYVPIDEKHPQSPINPYGESKLMVERLLRDYGNAYGLKSVALRYFNACGADPESEIGEDHDPETHLIPLVLWAAKGKREDIKMFGNDYPTPDGTCVRDYIHVTDLAQAHVLALEYLIKGGESDNFNLGNGMGYSVKEIIEMAKKVTGKEIKVTEAPRREGDPAVLVASSKKIREKLKWQPEYDLEAIIRTAWEWEKGR